MSNPNNQDTAMTAKEFTEAVIRIGLVFMLVVLCFRVFSPFMNLMLWALILAVTLYPIHQTVAGKLGGKQGGAATLIVVTGLLLLGIPGVMLGSSLASNFSGLREAYAAGTLSIAPPKEAVAGWPLIGQQVYDQWAEASANLPEFIEDNRAGIESIIKGGLAMAKNAASGIGLFFGALIVAGILMAFGRDGDQAMQSIFNRLAGPTSGPEVYTLTTMTTRSVAAGVLGVAVIQAALMGVIFMLAGVPAAGVLALIVLLLAIMQLPATLVGIPVIIWVWNGGDAGTTMNIVWTVLVIVSGLVDNFLKPMLLGRGVDAPMPVILIGALGGMISNGFIGLFTGAVLLAVGYQIFMRWVHTQQEGDSATAAGDAPE